MLAYFKRLFDSFMAPVPFSTQPTQHPSGTGLGAPVPTPATITVGTAGVVSPSPAVMPPPTPIIVPPQPATSVLIEEPVARLRNVGPTIAVVNMSTVLTNVQVIAATAAMQIQIDRDFAPAWHMSCNLMTVPTGAAVPDGTWILYIMDNSDQAGALGYHDLTSEGNPLGKVFAKDDQKYNLSWTVTASHEIVEMLCDPYIQNTVFVQHTNTTGTLYALEVADAVEDDSFGYLINGILVSDFVYPTWFESFRPANSTKFDHMGVLHAPLELAKGGYIGLFPVPNTTGWTQKMAGNVMPTRMQHRGEDSRSKRRNEKPLER